MDQWRSNCVELEIAGPPSTDGVVVELGEQSLVSRLGGIRRRPRGLAASRWPSVPRRARARRPRAAIRWRGISPRVAARRSGPSQRPRAVARACGASARADRRRERRWLRMCPSPISVPASATTTSQASAISRPPATAWPCSTATIGSGLVSMPTGERRHRAQERHWATRRPRDSASRCRRSAPAQKLGPGARRSAPRGSPRRAPRRSTRGQRVDQLGVERISRCRGG